MFISSPKNPQNNWNKRFQDEVVVLVLIIRKKKKHNASDHLNDAGFCAFHLVCDHFDIVKRDLEFSDIYQIILEVISQPQDLKLYILWSLVTDSM